MKLICAVDENWGIGYENKLIASVPEDMKLFKEKTLEGKFIVMGRKTFESIGNKPLPGRINIVLSSHHIEAEEIYHDKMIVLNSKEAIIDYLKSHRALDSTYVIGGSMIYKEFLPYVSELLITKYKFKADNVDIYFPIDLDKSKEFGLINESSERTYNNLRYSFCNYINYKFKRME